MALQMQPNHLRNLFLVLRHLLGNSPTDISFSFIMLYDIKRRKYEVLWHVIASPWIGVNDFVMSIKFPIRFYVNFV